MNVNKNEIGKRKRYSFVSKGMSVRIKKEMKDSRMKRVEQRLEK
jgi:hypothetical protein